MDMQIHVGYPDVIQNPFGIILGIKLVPSSLPKQGPKPLHEMSHPAILMACNLWDNKTEEGEKLWRYYYCHEPSVNARIDKFVREQKLNFNQWYYLDVFDFYGEFPNENDQ